MYNSHRKIKLNSTKLLHAWNSSTVTTKNEVQNPSLSRVKLNCMGNAHVPYSMFGKGTKLHFERIQETNSQTNKKKKSKRSTGASLSVANSIPAKRSPAARAHNKPEAPKACLNSKSELATVPSAVSARVCHHGWGGKDVVKL